MSTTDRRTRVASPWLVDGERLDRATFHERYGAMPDETRAELIGGVVHMASPLELGHGRFDADAGFWLGYYRSFTPGLDVLHNASVFLEDCGEHQPDIVLRIPPGYGGRTHDEGNDYIDGPELIVEVSDSSRGKDLGPKLADYERAGGPEYIVLRIAPPAVRWHVREESRLVEVGPDADGIYRSRVFPGLWLDPSSLLSNDSRAIRITVDRRVATPQHADFVARLVEAGGAGRG